MELSDFEHCVREAILALPERFRAKMDNVAFVVEPQSRHAQPTEIRIRRGSILLGLYQGVPFGQRGPFYSGALPDKITLFQDAIELVAGGDPEKIRQLVHETVEHEVAHYFGMDETAVRRMEHHKRSRRKGTPLV